MHSRASLAADFRALGVAAGDVVMLHASVRSVGEIAGGPDVIHLALRDALTDSGTLLMYASCPQYVDEIGRGNLTAAQEAELLEKLPPFDAATARAARDNGTLVEFFRTWPGTRVNDHPTRFAAAGPHADRLFASQPWDFAFGHGSALERFVDMDGKVLMLGCDHDTATFLHYAEHIVDIPDKRIARFRVPVMEGGVKVWKEMAEVDTSNGAHASFPANFFAQIMDGYCARTGHQGGRVGNADCVLVDARRLLDHALEEMQRVVRT